jgi:hypothetical protein
MAKVELEQETSGPAQSAPPPELVVGIPGLVDVTQVRSVAARWHGSGLRVAVVYPCEPGLRESQELLEEGSNVRLVPREIAPSSSATPPWLGQPVVYAALLGEAESLRANGCVILNPDLAAFTPRAVDVLAHPVLAGEYDLSMPIYRAGRFEGLLTQAVLAPVTRALYGKRVRYPLAQDFALSAAFLPQLRAALSTPAGAQGLLWPATQAAVRDRKICQVHLPVNHENFAAGLDLSTLLQLILAPFFADIEQNASVWQRIRGSQPTMEIGAEATAGSEPPAETVPDPRPMVDAFLLGQRNLQELWSLVLPPVTLLDLKRLSRQPLESFRMPDALWARVVYDFALAYRLRVLSRGHLLGALAPLYLGWVGSRVLEVGATTPIGPRQEELERAFEQNKPYLVQRWRWPDRFNP